ncbi:glutamate receptor ionotropic, delta-1-like [Oratosquilla oratoria]|uniref:glutamate receptor ionotropic, delta-1-like n=1 Tax=Oratosquilla oratoria TaxID=337810 RepID=UPI003F77377E
MQICMRHSVNPTYYLIDSISTCQYQNQTYDPHWPLDASALFPDRFDNFYNHHFRLASWIDDFPYLYYGKNKTVLGMGPTMLDEMARRLHFSYELFELSVDGFWGELVNGTWRGMIGELVRKEKDFVINGFVLVLDRSQAVDFSFPYITDSYTFVIKVPPPVPRWLAMVQPFGVNTWAALLASLCILALAFHLLVYTDSSPIYSHKADVLSSVIWLLRAVLRQSVPVIPSSRGSRVFLLCWWLAALVISTSYMGNLIAFITVPAQAQRLRTLSQLAESDFESNMLDYGNFVPGALKSSREPVLRELGDKLSLVDSYDEGIANMESGSHVLLEASAYIEYYMILQKQESVYFLEEKLYPGYVGWLFRKDTPWKYKVDQMLSWMAQTGLVSYWRRKNFEDFRRSQGLPAQRVEIQESLPRPLNLEDLQGAFLVLFLGLVAAALVLMIEVCMTKMSAE